MLKFKILTPNQLLLIYKPVSLTPHQMLMRFKTENPKYQNLTLSYAGRLDPMAEGALLVLVGEANKNRHDYEALDKEYEFEILCGIATDSGDLMGIPTKVEGVNETKSILLEKLNNWTRAHLGLIKLTLPVYSAKPVAGKPLYYHARHNTLSNITLPSQEVTVYSLAIDALKPISLPAVVAQAHEKITPVKGDFRQQEILKAWSKLLKLPNIPSLYLASGSCKVSSGTYIRGLVNQLEKDLSIPFLLYSLKRNAVGTFTFADVQPLASSTGGTKPE